MIKKYYLKKNYQIVSIKIKSEKQWIQQSRAIINHKTQKTVNKILKYYKNDSLYYYNLGT